MRWGLVPAWAESPDVGVKMINARAETLTERRSYRGLVKSAAGRCLVIADGFYEWAPASTETPKQPWRFTVDGGKPFAFAGLCSTWQPAEGPALRSLTVITTEPNSIVKPIHDRMPAILADQELRDAWLDQTLTANQAVELLGPLEAGRIEKTRVSRAVGNPRNEGPSLLVDEQTGLF